MSQREQLQEIVEHLASLERGACSPGEQEAAEWIGLRLEELGCEVAIEQELAFPSYAPALGALGAAAAAAGLVALRTRARLLPAAIAAAAAALVADDASNGRRPYRRAVMKQQTTWNVVARIGDPDAARTLVVLAHHDAHPASFIFDQRLERKLAERAKAAKAPAGTQGASSGRDSSSDGGRGGFPFWWPILAAPSLIALGALTKQRGITRIGLAGQAFGIAAALDLARHRIVPGANDNLSAVAGLVGVASELAEDPPPGVRVLLVSCGAEETLQGGIYGFVERHRAELDPATTSFLNFELLGARSHVLLEGEGPVKIEDYAGQGFRDLVAGAAEAGRRPHEPRRPPPRQHRLGRPQPRRLPDRDPGHGRRARHDPELPPDVGHAREPRLQRHRGRDQDRRGRGEGARVGDMQRATSDARGTLAAADDAQRRGA